MTGALSDRTGTKHHSLREFRYYDVLVPIFITVLLISNLAASKFVQIGPFTVSAVIILFPITYIFGDIFTEVYGYSGSRRAIWLGFVASGLMAALGMLIVALPPAPEFENQAAFETVFGALPRNVIASLIAYWAGEFANSYVLAKMKVWTKGRRLWTRTIGSTAVGQAVDSILVISIIFAGKVSLGTMVTLIWSGYFGKVLYEAAATPLTYLVVNGLKRAERVDVYDTSTNFNPFGKEKTDEVTAVLNK